MTIEVATGIARNVLANALKNIGNPKTIDTTDATATVLFSIEVGIFERGVINYTVNGIKDDGSTGISVYKSFSYKTDDTTLTVHTAATIFSQSDFSLATVAANANGFVVEIKVTGEAATNITWNGTYEQTKMNVEVAL